MIRYKIPQKFFQVHSNALRGWRNRQERPVWRIYPIFPLGEVLTEQQTVAAELISIVELEFADNRVWPFNEASRQIIEEWMKKTRHLSVEEILWYPDLRSE